MERIAINEQIDKEAASIALANLGIEYLRGRAAHKEYMDTFGAFFSVAPEYFGTTESERLAAYNSAMNKKPYA